MKRKHRQRRQSAQQFGFYIAAMFCGLFFGIKMMKHAPSDTANPSKNVSAQTMQADVSDRYIDDVCDFAGIESEQIYAYVTGSDAIY